MGLFSRKEQAVEQAPVAENLEGESRTWAAIDASTGDKVTESEALTLASVYYSTSLIADTISGLPVDVYKRDRNGIQTPVTKPTWLDSPSKTLTTQGFLHRVMTSLLLHGNAYIAVGRDDKGQVSWAMPLHPDTVKVQGNIDNPVYLVNDEVAKFEVQHIAGYTMPGSIEGVSPLEAARRTIDLGITAEEFGTEFFDSGIHMSGVIEHPGKSTKEESDNLRKQFSASHKGKSNAYAVGVLTGGAQWKPITITPEQAQFLETRKFNKTDIAMFYRIPAYMVDPSVTSTWGSGIQEQNTMLVQFTLMPWIIRMEQAFSRFMLPNGQFMKFNTNAFVRGRMQDRYSAYHNGIADGWLTRNEARAFEDLEPLPGLDEPLVPLNMTTVDNLDAVQTAPVTPDQDPSKGVE